MIRTATFFGALLISASIVMAEEAKPSPTVDYRSWWPTAVQIAEARQGAASYIEREFKVSRAKQETMKVRAYGRFKGAKKLIDLDFYDEVVFPQWEQMGKMLGGCPSYFSVTLEADSKKMEESYCSPE